MNRRAIPAVLLVPLMVVALVVSTAACGTMANFNNGVPLIGMPERERPPLPYGGVLWDVERAIESEVDVPTKVLILPIWLLDVGMSATLDTATLPITLWLSTKRAWTRATGEPTPYPHIEPKRKLGIDLEPVAPASEPLPVERILNPQFADQRDG